MEKKEIKKLILNKEVIANLDQPNMNRFMGGKTLDNCPTVPYSACYVYCTVNTWEGLSCFMGNGGCVSLQVACDEIPETEHTYCNCTK